jgi:hypothetical protein
MKHRNLKNHGTRLSLMWIWTRLVGGFSILLINAEYGTGVKSIAVALIIMISITRQRVTVNYGMSILKHYT